MQKLEERAQKLAGAQKLSSVLSGRIIHTTRDHHREQEICDRVTARNEVICHAVAASIDDHDKRKEHVTKCLRAMAELEFRCACALTISLSLNGEDMGEIQNLDFWPEPKEAPSGRTVLWINLSLANSPGDSNSIWDTISRSIAACPDVPFQSDDTPKIEKLLAARNNEILKLTMRNLKLPMEQMLTLLHDELELQSKPQSPTDPEPVDPVVEPTPPLQPPLSPVITNALPKVEPAPRDFDFRRSFNPSDRTGIRSETRKATPERPKSGSEPRQNHELARQAESWLRDELQQALSPLGFKVHHTVHRDGDHRKSDIWIWSLESSEREWHLEVKHLQRNSIYWSKLEIEKAKLKAPNYYMALLSGDEEPFDVCWLWNPLIDLAPLDRNLEWIWRETRVSMPHPRECDWLDFGTSQPRPEKDATHSHKITIPNEFFVTSSKPVDDLLPKLGIKT
jgi:hypothetical protein